MFHSAPRQRSCDAARCVIHRGRRVTSAASALPTCSFKNNPPLHPEVTDIRPTDVAPLLFIYFPLPPVLLVTGHNMYRIALTFTSVNVASLTAPLAPGCIHNGGADGGEGGWGKLAAVTSLKRELEVKGAEP